MNIWGQCIHGIVNITTRLIIIDEQPTKIFERGQLLKCCANERNSGINHPNYNKNVSDEDRVKDRRSIKNKLWRQEVIKRDNFTCQYCGDTNIRIVAHHLESYLANPQITI